MGHVIFYVDLIFSNVYCLSRSDLPKLHYMYFLTDPFKLYLIFGYNPAAS